MYSLPQGIEFFQRGWLSSNNVLIHDSEQAVIVDTGYWTHAEQTLALIKTVIADRGLTAIYNTHLHSDHCGGNSYLQSYFPCVQTLIPPGQAGFVEHWNPDALTYTATGQHCPMFGHSGTLNPGNTFVVGGLTWHIFAAPGHDPHSVVIFNDLHGILISADALWENGFGVVFPEIEGISAFDEVEATLDLIERLAPKIILPGHGEPFADVASAIARARSRLNQFRSFPDKHANYAAKVLLKFKLLELQECHRSEFVNWAKGVTLLNLLYTSQCNGYSFGQWINRMCENLEKSGACAFNHNHIINSN